MTTLRELRAYFLKRQDDLHFKRVDTIGEADGVSFLCPKCFAANRGSLGTHSVICWSPAVPQSTHPKPGRWELQGTGIDDITLVAGSSSVLLTAGCNAHFFVRGGQIEDC
jgi:hypothetical protein